VDFLQQQTEYQSLLREEDNAPLRSTGAGGGGGFLVVSVSGEIIYKDSERFVQTH
jgi:hypothetical protein